MFKTAGWVADIVEPDQMSQNVSSDFGLHCLHWPVCPSTSGKYCNIDLQVLNLSLAMDSLISVTISIAPDKRGYH